MNERELEAYFQKHKRASIPEIQNAFSIGYEEARDRILKLVAKRQARFDGKLYFEYQPRSSAIRDSEGKKGAEGSKGGGMDPDQEERIRRSLAEQEPVYRKVLRYCMEFDTFSIGSLQRRFQIGFVGCTRVIDWLVEMQIVVRKGMGEYEIVTRPTPACFETGKGIEDPKDGADNGKSDEVGSFCETETDDGNRIRAGAASRGFQYGTIGSPRKPFQNMLRSGTETEWDAEEKARFEKILRGDDVPDIEENDETTEGEESDPDSDGGHTNDPNPREQFEERCISEWMFLLQSPDFQTREKAIEYEKKVFEIKRQVSMEGEDGRENLQVLKELKCWSDYSFQAIKKLIEDEE